MAFLFETLVQDVGVLSVCVLAVVYVYFKVSFDYWKKRNVPYAKPTFPFGNFGDKLFLRATLCRVFENIYKELDGEKYGGTYALTKPGFIFRDPDIIKNVLVKDFSSFHDRGLFVDEVVEPLAGHLFFLRGNKWRNLRAKLSPTFTSGKMKMMFQTLVDCGLELGSILEKSASNEEVIEMKDILARYSTDVIASCAFGIQCNCFKNPDAEFRQWGRKIYKPSLRTSIIIFIIITIPLLLTVLKLNDFMHLFIQLKNKVKLDEENESLEHNVLGTLKNSSSEEGMYRVSSCTQIIVLFISPGVLNIVKFYGLSSKIIRMFHSKALILKSEFSASHLPYR
jgi:cytochrome P450 family 6